MSRVKKKNKSLIFLFLDGLGLGDKTDQNPLFTSKLPNLKKLLKGTLTKDVYLKKDNFLLKGIDACLGVDGIPQSATGQTAIFTGVNAPKFMNCHIPALPTPALREIIAEKSIFLKLKSMNLSPIFANSYSRNYLNALEDKKVRASVTTYSVLAAGGPFNDECDLADEKAVYWDITHEASRYLFNTDYETRTPQRSAEILYKIATEHDFVVFETFITDMAGHQKRLKISSEKVLEDIIDPFIGTIVDQINRDNNCGNPLSDNRIDLFITSDHGNIEDLSSRRHTLNEVPLLYIGPETELFDSVKSIADIKDAIVQYFK